MLHDFDIALRVLPELNTVRTALLISSCMMLLNDSLTPISLKFRIISHQYFFRGEHNSIEMNLLNING